MKTQEQTNAEWHQTFESNAGQCTLLVKPARIVPGLRKPYEYEVTAQDARNLIADLNATLRHNKQLLQCGLVDKKTVTYGIRFNLFLLSYRRGLVSDSAAGCSPGQWQAITEAVVQRIKATLGDDCPVYVEPWTPDAKFQARFETYIKFREL